MPGLPITGARLTAMGRKWKRSGSWPDTKWPPSARRTPGPEEEVGVAEEDAEGEDVSLEPGANGCADPWSTSRPTLLRLAVQGGQVGADGWARQVLGQEVSRVGSPDDLEECEMTSTQPLLDPQLSHR